MSGQDYQLRFSTVMHAELNDQGVYQVTVIRAGPANGWEWPPDVLAAGVADGHFAQLASFVDHRDDPTLIGSRSVRDLCGVVYDGVFDAEAGAVRGLFRALGPQGAWVDGLVREALQAEAEGQPTPPLGLSIDVTFSGKAGRVERIVRVHSADVVYDPAAGGAFEARLGIEGRKRWEGDGKGEEGEGQQAAGSKQQAGGQGEEGGRRKAEGGGQMADGEWQMAEGGCVSQKEASVSEMTGQTAMGGAAETLSEGLLRRQCAATLSAALAASDLPTPLREEVRSQFQDRVFSPAELDAALAGKRATWAALAQVGVVRGMGLAVGGQGAEGRGQGAGVRGQGAGVGGMATELERLQLAVDRLLGLPLPDAQRDTPRLVGIRDLYHRVTGDYDLHGVFDAERSQFANANATTMASLVTNAMNKVVAARTADLGRAGYDWWRRVVYEEDFTTLQDIKWITVGGFGDLPTVAEGAAYTELTWDDNAETTAWTKKGGYIGLTLEMIDRDETRRVRQIPLLLATAAVRTLSGTVAGLFTQNSGVGPDLADGTALFHSSRGNLGTSALSATTWDTAVQAMFKLTELNSGKRLGIRPRYVLTPIELEKTALQIFVSGAEPSSNLFYDNVRRSSAENVVTVPEWTDANDWAAVADPAIAPGIGVGYRFGRQPEVFVADQPEVGSMFTNDELRVKTRFLYGVGVIDYRALYKANVP